MAPLKNIVWVGTGVTSVPVLKRVIASNKFSIKLLVRNPVSTYTSLPTQLSSVHQVDYGNHKVLVEHLRGQDAVVVFNSLFFGHQFDKKHIALVNAAIEAGVKYFVPSEWALDTAGDMGSTSEKMGPTLPTNMVLAPKRVAHNYLLARVAEGKINFAAIYPGVLIESTLQVGSLPFNFAQHTGPLPDGGAIPFAATSYTTLSKAVISLLSDPSKFHNSFYHIADGVLTPLDVLHIFEKETGVKWKTTSYSIKERSQAALANMKKGVFGVEEFFGTLAAPFFGGLQVFTNLDNEIFGIERGEVDIREEVARYAREQTAAA
ncbi:isoflavone reductase family protein [Xylogone sp. PMI_703]|nr:isoflavone reductase family protein [Xylogone sp. PMI_703]